MHDRICWIDENLLHRAAGPYIGSDSEVGPARAMSAADLWGPSCITDQKLKGCVTLVQRPPFTTARNEEFAPCRMFGPNLSCGPLKMSW